VGELIERGEISAIREAMEQSLAQGSRTFEQDLFRLFKDKVITLEEALANSDSPTNLSWLINNAQFGNGSNEKSSRSTVHHRLRADRAGWRVLPRIHPRTRRRLTTRKS
jgi:twitching motility protein PilU